MKRERQIARVCKTIRYMARAIDEGWLVSPELAESAIRAAASAYALPFTDCTKCGVVLVASFYRIQDPYGGGLSGLDAESYPVSRSRSVPSVLCVNCAESASEAAS